MLRPSCKKEKIPFSNKRQNYRFDDKNTVWQNAKYAECNFRNLQGKNLKAVGAIFKWIFYGSNVFGVSYREIQQNNLI